MSIEHLLCAGRSGGCCLPVVTRSTAFLHLEAGQGLQAVALHSDKSNEYKVLQEHVGHSPSIGVLSVE